MVFLAAAAVRLEVRHRTLLTYSEPIAETYMQVRLRPRDGAGQTVQEFTLAVSPRTEARSYLDGFGNYVHFFNYVPPHGEVEVIGHSVVSTSSGVPDPTDTDFPEDFLQFSGPVMDVAGVRAMARRSPTGAVEERLDQLAAYINQQFEYRPQTTDVFTAVDEVIHNRVGVCQDFAHLFISVARSMQIPTRYVSGYIHAGKGRRGGGASHAWAESLVPGRGWIGYDPTNPIRTSEHHVRVAVGRDYRDISPTRGTYVGAASERMTVEVDTAIREPETV
jgi:transglutaminase-like putative cysteine protease